jgi:photosystem II stability/assembly factor-like uncharacterized protein
MRRIHFLSLFLAVTLAFPLNAQRKKESKKSSTASDYTFSEDKFKALQWRNIGPFRGGRAVAVAGVPGNTQEYYFGSVGGGVWKTTDAGLNWQNISDGYFESASVGAIAVAPSDPNVVYVGMGEHSIRGVMTSQGDGMYKSTDRGKTWKHMGLAESKTIAAIRIHPENPEQVYVAVQGSQWADSDSRGVYKSSDGGSTWKKVFYLDESTGAADLDMDPGNPRILYAGMWDHRRDPWRIRSGGEGSGLYKSTDAGESWEAINKGLPEVMGKVAVSVSPASPNRLYANIEAEGDQGGVYRSDDAGKSWKQVSRDRNTVARAWYYIEVVADPRDPETVYILNSPMLKSIDGGKTFQSIAVAHVDQHDLWINPENPANLALANDGGTCISFNGGKSWSTQNNQPTAQFYRVITDDQFPYRIYGGQQDNSTVSIASKTIYGGITESDWFAVAGGESAFLAFNDPENPRITYGSSIQGFIDLHDRKTGMSKDIMAHPAINLGSIPKDQKYRFNWNGPLVHNQVNPQIIYQGGNKLLRSDNGGFKWTIISPDLTRNDSTKHTQTGVPFTNEAAGGEVYNTISYIASSPNDAEVIWVGSDDGLVHVTKDEGKSWSEVSPPVDGESLINAIEVSPHNPGRVYLAVTRYKFDDLRPLIFVSNDYGESWELRVKGIQNDHFVRVVREDPLQEGLLYAGTENGVYISFDFGEEWHTFQSNLPVTPVTDLIIKDNDLIAATSGRAFWILDDLSALQQSAGSPDTTSLQLFAPKTTTKFTLGGGFEKGGNRGQNPWPGVTIDYYLPHDFSDSSELKLEILNDKQQVIRTFSNIKSADFKTWTGGPPPPKVIPASPGLNRTNWDLARESLPGVEGVFVLGSLAGSTVGPGNYSLRLSSGEEVLSQEFTLLADPRLEASAEDFMLQKQMLEELEEAITDIHLSVSQMRMVKKQLSLKLELMEDLDPDPVDSLLVSGQTALDAIDSWEKKLIQPRQKTFQDVINFENRLSAEFNMLRSKVDSYDPRLTDGVKERSVELQAAWGNLKSEMTGIINKEIGTFNAGYRESELPALILPESGN